MIRLDLFLRAGGLLDLNTWHMLNDEQRDRAADMGDVLRKESAASIADALLSRLPEAVGLDPDDMAQRAAEMLAGMETAP